MKGTKMKNDERDAYMSEYLGQYKMIQLCCLPNVEQHEKPKWSRKQWIDGIIKDMWKAGVKYGKKQVKVKSKPHAKPHA